jgi:hypothetical protein
MSALGPPDLPQWIDTILLVVSAFTAIVSSIALAVGSVYLLLRRCIAVRGAWHELLHGRRAEPDVAPPIAASQSPTESGDNDPLSSIDKPATALRPPVERL